MDIVLIEISSEICGKKESRNKRRYLAQQADHGADKTFSCAENDTDNQYRHDQDIKAGT